MSIFSKLAFWKKKEPRGFGGLPPLPGEEGAPGQGGLWDTGLPELGTRDYGPPMGSPMQQPDIRPPPLTPVTPLQQQQFASQGGGYNKDIEVVSAKLDAIRVTLDSINQRLANLERIAYKEEEKTYYKRQW